MTVSLARGKRERHAVVLGASMAGLLAGRVLVDHFDQVTLLERDFFPAPGANRKGVPQGKQTHVLLERGRQVMERYLPGLTDDLARLGAVTIADASWNLRWFHGSQYHQPGHAGFSGMAISRPALEAAVRERVQRLPNVRIVAGCSVRGLESAPAGDGATGRQVSGVRVSHRQDGSQEETLKATLVVDASGRGSRSPAWLEALGYKRPPEDEVRVGIGYVTTHYHRSPEELPGLEGIVQMAAPLGEPAVYHFPANLRRRYDRLPAFPEGYLILGDALCSFNPTYGQGMRVAALEAAVLDTCLAEGRAGLAPRFFDRAKPLIDDAWRTAVWGDLSFPGVEGARPPLMRFFHWYGERLHAAARRDAQVSIAFIKVINMLASPLSILHPRIAWRVFRGAW